MGELRFFKTVLVEITSDEAMEIAHPIYHKELDIKERIGKCPECDSNSYRLFDDTSCAVREGGKQYVECIGCGETTHL